MKKEISLTLNIHIMKRTMYAAAVCAAVIMFVLPGCEPEEAKILTPTDVIEAYLPYRTGDNVTYRSDSGDEVVMTVIRADVSNEAGEEWIEKTVMMASADSAMLLQVMAGADCTVMSMMAMSEHWLGQREESDMRAGEYYVDQIDFKMLTSIQGEHLIVSNEGYGVYYNNDSGESSRSDDGYCVIGRWRGFVEFTTYGEVWRLVE